MHPHPRVTAHLGLAFTMACGTAVHSPDSRAAGEELPPLIVLEHHAAGMMAHFEVVR